ncbi:uncharacterized protein [Clytia hemisphaerica]|uniref:uncharacterized protein isoform X4 n=1 Tax=Clytia hemisphaerica TaxID=252671 RepID=UPI0034D75FAF
MTKRGNKGKGSTRAKQNKGRQQHEPHTKDAVERKRDERTQKNKLKKERRLKEFHGDYTDDDFVKFKRQLEYQGFKLREIQGDGNCLFRALADQLNGDDKLHMRHRKDVVEYMKNHEDDFAPFLDETVTFEKYLKNLSSTGTYGGNDSIVAFARKNTVDVVIHQYDSPAFIINGSEGGCTIKVHLAYHTMEHYSSVRTAGDPGDGPAHMFHTTKLLTKQSNSEKPKEEKKKSATAREEERIAKEKEKERKFHEDLNRACAKSLDDEGGDSDEYVNVRQERIEMIKGTTGFHDERKIGEYLKDNEEDVDSTMSFILQMMALSEASDDKATVCEEVDSSATERNAKKSLIETEEIHTKSGNVQRELKTESGNTNQDVNPESGDLDFEKQIRFDKECKTDFDLRNLSPTLESISPVSDSDGNTTSSTGDEGVNANPLLKKKLKVNNSDGHVSDEFKVRTDSVSLKQRDNVIYNDSNKDNEAIKEQEENPSNQSRDGEVQNNGREEKCECNLNLNSGHQQQLPDKCNKQTMKESNQNNQNKKTQRNYGSKHLSNRQRKELAKQERKKRREEMKKDGANISTVANGDGDEVPIVPKDIQVIAI